MSTFKFNEKSFRSTMNQRGRASKEQAAKSKTVIFTIKGNGNVIDVKNKAGEAVGQAANPDVVLQKKIFNTNINSDIATSNPANIKLFSDARKAEKAGETETAHELYNELANKLQVSFGLLLPSKLEYELSNGVECSAKLQLVTTDNGSIITIDPKTIRVMEPEVLATGGFAMEDPFAGSEEEETEGVSAEEALTA
jgi:hypothetical protein